MKPSRLFLLTAFILPILVNEASLAHPGGHERIKLLSQQIEKNPQNADLLIKRALEALEEHRSYEAAEADLNAAKPLISNEKTGSQYHYVMGLFHHFQKRYQEADSHFKSCLQLQPSNPLCRRKMAESASAQNNLSRATSIYTDLLRTSPSVEADDYFQLVQMLVETGQHDQALTYIAQAQKKFGFLPHFEKLAVTIEQSRGNFSNAFKHHNKLKPYFGKTPQWQYKQGMLFLESGDATQAKTMLDEALTTLNRRKKNTQVNIELRESIQIQLKRINQKHPTISILP